MKNYLFYISQNYSFAILRPIKDILLSRGDNVQWFFEGNAVTESFLMPNEPLISNVHDIFKYKPDVIIATANSIPTFIPGLKVLVFHGFDAGKVDKRGNNDHFKIRGCFDLYCTQGPSTTKEFKRLQQSHPYCNIIETGWSTYDPLFNTDDASLDHKATETKQPTIFLGSTFSKSLTQAEYIFPVVKHLSETMNWKWIVSLHPKSNEKVINLYKSIESDNLEYQSTDDMLPILQEADIMVGDTSSALIMFIVQNKPAITVNNINPQPYYINITDKNALKMAIEKAFSKPDDVMKSIAEYNQETHPYQDGQSSVRVIQAIDDVLANKYPVTQKKPLNLLKNFKFRKRLNYWSLPFNQ